MTLTLYGPTGRAELDLVAATGWRAWPRRLPERLIFYPGLSFEYAEKIARDWNSVGSPDEGFVTRFAVTDEIAERCPAPVAGDQAHQELRVPAEEPSAFNAGIVGLIEVVAEHPGGARAR